MPLGEFENGRLANNLHGMSLQNVNLGGQGARSVTFDDEGLSWIEFSAAVPVKNPAMFALMDLYFRPVDIASTMGRKVEKKWRVDSASGSLPSE